MSANLTMQREIVATLRAVVATSVRSILLLLAKGKQCACICIMSMMVTLSLCSPVNISKNVNLIRSCLKQWGWVFIPISCFQFDCAENKSLSDVLRVVIISSNVSEPDWHVLETIRMGTKEFRTG